MTHLRMARALAWWYSWTGLGSSEIPAYGDGQAGADIDYLQRTSLAWPGGIQPEMPFADTVADYFTMGADPLTVAAGDSWPTKSDWESNRTWNPALNNDQVSGVGSTWNDVLDNLTVTWTDDPDVPAADGSWARNELEVRVRRCTGSGCSSFSEIGTSDYGDGSYLDTTTAASTTYVYELAYRSKSDGTLIGPTVTYEVTTGS